MRLQNLSLSAPFFTASAYSIRENQLLAVTFTMMKKILIAILLIGVVAGVIGYKMYNKPHNEMVSMKSEANLDAKQLQAAFEADESAANEQYLGKVITVSGKVAEIKKEGENNSFIILDTGNMLSAVKCQLDHLTDHPNLSDLKKGDQVQVKGICTGYLMDVILERGIIL